MVSSMAKPKASDKKGQKSITAFFGGGNKSQAKAPEASEQEDEEMDVDEEGNVVSRSEVENGADDSDDDAPIVKVKTKRKAKVLVLEDDESAEEDAPIVKKKGKAKAKTTVMKDGDSEEDDAPVSKKKVKATPPDMSDLPPINQIPDMFADLVGKVKGIKDVAERIRGRKLRVATMCSGTESPLLALDMICKAVLDTYEIPLEVEHVFSCEIEPFKQAYIERNFHPPLLFRDVCELGDEEA